MKNYLCFHRVRKAPNDQERDMTYHCLREYEFEFNRPSGLRGEDV